MVRTDNTGKNTDKGARGTSGKRDDVDIELVLIPDTEKPGRLRIRPGKVRLPGIEQVIITRETDEDGQLTYSTAGDPFRVLVADAHQLLAFLAIPVETGERAAEAIKNSGHKVVRAALRVALKERKNPLPVRSTSAPSPYGAVRGATDTDDCAEQVRRTFGAPLENTQSEREKHAEPKRRTTRATDTDAHDEGAPPLSLSKSGAPAHGQQKESA